MTLSIKTSTHGIPCKEYRAKETKDLEYLQRGTAVIHCTIQGLTFILSSI